jgi:hypothetical protein
MQGSKKVKNNVCQRKELDLELEMAHGEPGIGVVEVSVCTVVLAKVSLSRRRF